MAYGGVRSATVAVARGAVPGTVSTAVATTPNATAVKAPSDAARRTGAPCAVGRMSRSTRIATCERRAHRAGATASARSVASRSRQAA